MLHLINLKHNPFLIRLKREDEELSDLLKLPPDELLLRWFNYHLANSNYGKQVGNFSADLKVELSVIGNAVRTGKPTCTC